MLDEVGYVIFYSRENKEMGVLVGFGTMVEYHSGSCDDVHRIMTIASGAHLQDLEPETEY